MNKIFILLLMIFLHIGDDYYLQKGLLNFLKQKSWWREQKDYIEMYKYDYICALLIHSFSWSFMIMLPIAFNMNFNITFEFIYIFLFNMIAHAIVDDIKANKKYINLIVDQLIHIIQICFTWFYFIF